MSKPLIDEVEAFNAAREYVQKHGPDYWQPSFSIFFDDDQYSIRTNSCALGSNATITVCARTGKVLEANWNPM